jgi:RHS repeat-associated protein
MWFGFDPLGRCVKRWVGPQVGGHAPPPNTNPATYYYHDGWSLVQEGSSGNNASRLYVHGGRVDEIVASQGGGEWRHHHYDARGHCIMLTDTNGVIREQYDYDAFGLPYFYNASGAKLGASAQWGNRLLFGGREWLQDLRIYDFRNRQYQPELGRFLQPDPTQFAAGDYNLYRYCHNDPVNKADPLGLAPVQVQDDVDQLARALLDNNVTLTNLAPAGSRLEAGNSIFRNDVKGRLEVSKTVRGEHVPGGLKQQLHPPMTPPGHTREADTHSHVVDLPNKKTGGITSDADVRRSNFTGAPEYTAAKDKNGNTIYERYRPSDAKTVPERIKEGGILERLENGKWQRYGN